MPPEGTVFLCDPSGGVKKEVMGRPEDWIGLLRETGALPPRGGLKHHEHLITLEEGGVSLHVLLHDTGGPLLVAASSGPDETAHLLSRAAEHLPDGVSGESPLPTAAGLRAEGVRDDAALMDDMTRLNNELVALQRELARKNAELERLNREVREMSVTDTLTGVLNRRGFFGAAQGEMARVRRYGGPLSAIMLDIDHFKRINDSLGHRFGDRVLREVALRCREHLRQTDILGRYGGEEFAVLLTETDLEGAFAAAERVRTGVCKPMEIEGKSLKVTVSLGVSAINDPGMTLEELLHQADTALYGAKESGRNRTCTHDGG